MPRLSHPCGGGRSESELGRLLELLPAGGELGLDATHPIAQRLLDAFALGLSSCAFLSFGFIVFSLACPRQQDGGSAIGQGS